MALRRAIPVALATVVAGFVPPGTAAGLGRTGATIDKSRLLWATVNVCDTVGHPNTIGIRASMPGSGLRQERMYVRFQVQYVSSADGLWHNLGPSGDSGFVKIGSAKYRARQAGQSFAFDAPQAGKVWKMRGAVTFEWRRGGDLVRRARKRTTARHPGTLGADPAGFSAATCEIR